MQRICALLFVLAQLSLALPYTADSGVINLNKKNFAEQVFGSEHVWIVEFYAPWCGHCKSMAGDYQKLAKNLKGVIKVGAVNADEEKELAGHFEIKGFPTIKVFGSQLKPTPDGKGVTKTPEDYQGARTADGMANYALSKLPNFVTKVTASNIDSFLAKDLAKVILFSNKPTTTTLYKALAIDFHHRLEVGEVKHTEEAVVTRFGIEKYPTLIVQTSSGDTTKYEGALSHAELFKFLTPYAKPLQKPTAGSSSQSEKAEPPPPEPVREVRVEVENQETFENVCLNKPGNCLIALLNGGDIEENALEKQIELLEKLQAKYSSFYKFIWIDGVKQPQFLDAFSLSSDLPALVVFNNNRKSAVPFRGSFSEASISEYLDRIMSGSKKAVPVRDVPSFVVPKKDEL